MKVQCCEYCLHTYDKAPPEDVHINDLLLNANAHGRFCFVEAIFKCEDNEDNDMHNGKWTSVELLHAEFIIASQRSRRPSSLSVTTQRTKCIK